MTLPAGIKKIISEYLYDRLSLKKSLELCRSNIVIQNNIVNCNRVEKISEILEILSYFIKHGITNRKLKNMVELLKIFNEMELDLDAHSSNYILHKIDNNLCMMSRDRRELKKILKYHKYIQGVPNPYPSRLKNGGLVQIILNHIQDINEIEPFEKAGINFDIIVLYNKKLMHIFDDNILDMLLYDDALKEDLIKYAKSKNFKTD